MAVFVLANLKAQETGGVLRGPIVASADSVDGAAWAEVVNFTRPDASAVLFTDAMIDAGGSTGVMLDVTAIADTRVLISTGVPAGAARGWYIVAGSSATFGVATGDRIFTRTP